MLFRCVPRAPAESHGGRPIVRKGSKSRVVDLHCHRESKAATDMMTGEEFRPLPFGSEITREVNRQQMIDIRPHMESVERRLADMDKMGVDVQAVSSAPYQYYYNADPELGRASARQVNDDLAALVAAHPDRFVGLGTLPLQDSEMAVAELVRAVKDLGLRGIEIGTNVNGEEISAPRLAPVWAKVEELDVVVFIHPSGITHPQRLGDHYLANIVGNPMETTLALSHLIFDGVLERHAGLKIVAAHGGGFLGAYPARMDHGYHARRDVRENLPKPPTEYLKRIHFDTMVFDPDQIAFLIKKYGADHVVLGTDYPYDMGMYDPLALIGRVPGIDDATLDAIAGGNAARLLKLQ
jgi:aminocarboxymuconate-semialdehyde decarboxylase